MSDEFYGFDNEDFDGSEYDGERYCFTCNNLGTVHCECGGDICVCLEYGMSGGEMPCPDCGGR